jgi:hypothetical protein
MGDIHRQLGVEASIEQAGDSILALVNKENLPRVRGVLSEVAA